MNGLTSNYQMPLKGLETKEAQCLNFFNDENKLDVDPRLIAKFAQSLLLSCKAKENEQFLWTHEKEIY